ncbi:MAG: chaperone NapD [Alphaproteobacteria bacterium]|nr:chaperone NapD [Alphaproteobacteria bacterium]
MRINRFNRPEPKSSSVAAVNICGVLVHARPNHLPSVRTSLQALPGVEIHQESPEGRLVLTVEDTAESWAGETIKQIQDVQGVLSASLIYHHFDESHLSGETCS